MNSINERLKRLQNKIEPIKTRKGNRLEKIKKELFEKQKGYCAGCGWRFDNYNDKPKFDFPTKKYNYPFGLVCAKCEQILDASGRDVNILNKIINYLTMGKKDQELFDTVKQTINDASKTEPSKMGYFDTNWSNVKPNE